MFCSECCCSPIMYAISNWRPSFRFDLKAWPARRHGVTITMLLLVVISLPGIDATTGFWPPEPTPRQGRVLNAYTALTDSNIKIAAELWVSNQASATSTYGIVRTWDLSQVTSLEKVWCGWDANECFSAYMGMRSFNGDISMWDVSKVTSMYRSKLIHIQEWLDVTWTYRLVEWCNLKNVFLLRSSFAFFSCALIVNVIGLLFLRQSLPMLPPSTATSITGTSRKLPLCTIVSQ